MTKFLGAFFTTFFLLAFMVLVVVALGTLFDLIGYLAFGATQSDAPAPVSRWEAWIVVLLAAALLIYVIRIYWRAIFFRQNLLRKIALVSGRFGVIRGAELLVAPAISYDGKYLSCAVAYQKDNFRLRFDQKQGPGFMDFNHIEYDDDRYFCHHVLTLSNPVMKTVQSNQKIEETTTTPPCLVFAPYLPVSVLYNALEITSAMLVLLKIPILTPAVTLFCSSTTAAIELTCKETAESFLRKVLNPTNVDENGKLKIPEKWPRGIRAQMVYYRMSISIGIVEFCWTNATMRPREAIRYYANASMVTGKPVEPKAPTVLIGTPVSRVSKGLQLQRPNSLWEPSIAKRP